MEATTEPGAGIESAPGGADATQGLAPVTQETAPKTIAEGAKPEGAPPPPPDWPADWREKAAGEDAKYLDHLKTLGSPVDLAKSYRELQKKMDGTKRLPELPDKPTEAQVAEYRKAVGVPESPDKYDFNLGDGFVWADNDKPRLESFAKFAHDAHMPERYAKTAVAGYALMERQIKEEYANKDKEFFHNSINELAKEWGVDYDGNHNAAKTFIERIPEGDRYDFLMARAPNGKMIGNHPGILKWAMRMELDRNPAATILPASGGDPTETTKEAWDKAMKKRREDPDGYYDPEYQKKVKKLAEAMARLEERGQKVA